MGKSRTLLLIDDNLAHGHSFQDALLSATDGPFYGEWAKTVREGVEILAQKQIWAIFLNLCLPGDLGLSHYDELRKSAPGIPTLVLAGIGDEPMALEALRRGAKDFLLGTHIDAYSFARAMRQMAERERAEEDLFTEKQRARVTLDSIGDAVLSTDMLGHVTYLNGVAEKLTGWSKEEAFGMPLAQVFKIIDGVTREPSPDPMELAVSGNKTVGLTANCILVRRDGVESAIEDSAAPIHDRSDTVEGAVIVFRDVTTSRAMAGEMMHLAQHDNLTDLPNRTLLKDRLAQAIATAHRNNTHVALMFLDLDNFKNINDSLGHPIGDKLLQSVAARLKSSVRSSDTVSRQGGDEFVLLLSEINRATDAGLAAGKILVALAAPQRLDQHDLEITASIGISTYPEDGNDVDSLMKKADSAMYRAKQNGRNNYQVYSADMIAAQVLARKTLLVPTATTLDTLDTNRDRNALQGTAIEFGRLSDSIQMSDESKNEDSAAAIGVVTLPGTVDKIIPAIGGQPEKAQITVEGAEALYREIRVDSTLQNLAGDDVGLKLGAEVEITIETKPEATKTSK